MTTGSLWGVDLLLICPGLSAERREESLALLRGTHERMQIPFLELSSDTEKAVPSEEVRDEVGIVPWPIDLEGLSREINAALDPAGRGDQGGGAIFENPPAEGEPAF
jgi:hypothetical protein